MDSDLRILLLEDNKSDVELTRSLLQREGIRFDLRVADSREELLKGLTEFRPHLVLSDYSLPSFDGLAALALVREVDPQLPVILVSGTMGEDVAINALKMGATDYIIKDRLSRLPAAINRALREMQERKEIQQMHQALRESEELYRNLFENSADAIIYCALDGSVLMCNRQTADLLQHEKEGDLVGRNVFEFIVPEFHELAKRKAAFVLGQGKPHSYEYALLRKDGTPVQVEVSSSLIKDSLANPKALSNVLRDISERKKTESLLREQAALIDFDPDAIIVRDIQDKILFWSKGAQRLYGWSQEEVLGKRVVELLFDEVPLEYNLAQEEVVSKETWQGEWTHISKKRQQVIVTSHWTLVRDESGTPKAIYSVNTDITETKKLQSQLQRAQRLESIGTLAGGIAHDLNNALGPILLAVQVLRKSATNDQAQKMLDMLETSTKRGADMVKQVLTFARGIEGKRMLLQPKHLLNEMEEIARKTFPPSITIESDLPKDLWTLNGDATQIHQVLLNLCINARDAMEQHGGRLRLTAQNVTLDEQYVGSIADAKPGPYVVFTVSDTGAGMPPDVVEKIFEPFYTTKQPGKGTGLGLSTSLGIVKSHNGFINVYSEPGRGTTFKIYFPASLPATSTTEKTTRGNELPIGSGETILIVDDEAIIREITSATLSAFGYKVMTASDGTEAIALFVQHKDAVKLVICDVMMPHLDGPATIRALQRIEPSVNLVVVSGLMENQRMVDLATSENITFLQKPYTTEKLLTTIDSLLHRPGE